MFISAHPTTSLQLFCVFVLLLRYFLMFTRNSKVNMDPNRLEFPKPGIVYNLWPHFIHHTRVHCIVLPVFDN